MYSLQSFKKLNVVVITLTLLWLALSDFNADMLARTSKNISQYPWELIANMAESIAFLVPVATLLLVVLGAMAMWRTEWQAKFGVALMVFAMLPLLQMLSHPVWIDSLGGFPAIGAGQGIIKYASLFALGYLLYKPNIELGKWLAWFGPALVLIWIGGMKFTELEAKGIEDLVATSPFMSWLYDVTDLMGASIIIGIWELIAAAGLLVMLFRQLPTKVSMAIILMNLIVYIGTLSFFFSWPGALNQGILLSGGGVFLIKDVWLALATVWVFYLTQQDSAELG